MKTILLVLAIAASAVANERVPKVFSPNREYRYEYESQILTGIPILNSQYSGLKLKARVIMHMGTDNYVNIKLSSIQVQQVKPEAGVIPTVWLDSRKLEDIPSEHSAQLIEALSIPMKFRYTMGLVSKVYAVENDPYWSVNIKRGIVSLMQLDLNAENPVPVEVNGVNSYMDIVSSDYSTMTRKSAYKVIEPSTLGDCETFYSIIPISSMAELIVSKTVDTKRCSPKVIGEWGLLSGLMDANTTQKVMSPSISVDYVLSGSRHEFLIKSAILVARYSHIPVINEPFSLEGIVMQKLKYAKDEPLDSRITFESSPVPLKNGLHAHLPLQSVVKQEVSRSLRPAVNRLSSNKIQMVDHLLENIIEKTATTVQAGSTDMVMTVVTILRTLSKEELFDIAKQYVDAATPGHNSLASKKSSMILELLPTLPHPDIPLILVRLVKEQKISGIYAATLINIATICSTPSPALLNELLEMTTDSVIVNQPVVRRAVLLGAGTMAHKLVKTHKLMGLPKEDAYRVVKDIVKVVKSMLESSDPDTRIAVIKLIGNSGMVEFFPDLERMINDKTMTPFVRSQSVFALRRMLHTMPSPIRMTLMPIYLDTHEPEMLRIAAFVMTMETMPDMATIKLLGNSLSTEPSIQIASFVYSFMNNVARSPMPDVQAFAMMVRRVLKTVKPVNTSPLFNSKAISVETFCKYLSMGMGIEIGKFQKTNRIIPRALITVLDVYFHGKTWPLMEMGLTTSGLDMTLRKLIGVEGILADIIAGRKNINEMFEPLTKADMGVVEEEIRKLFAETNSEKTLDAWSIGTYYKLLGNELNYFHFGKETIKEAIHNMASSSAVALLDKLIAGYNLDMTKALAMMDNALILPTPMGLPLTLNTSVVALLGVKGMIQLEGVTSAHALLNMPSKLSVLVKARPSASIKFYYTLGVQHDLMTFGTTLKKSAAADLPIDFKVSVDRVQEKISVKVNLPKEVNPFVKLSMKPQQFSHFVPVYDSSYTSGLYDIHTPRAVAINSERIFETVSYVNEYVVPVLDIKAKINAVSEYAWPGVSKVVTVFASKQEAVIELEPSYRAPDALVCEVFYGRKPEHGSGGRDGWFSWMSSDSQETHAPDEYDVVIPSPAISEPIKKKIYATLATVGGYRETLLKSKLTLITDPAWMQHQINLQLIGTNVFMSQWKAKVETLLDLPKLINVTIGNSIPRSSDVIASTDLSFGVRSFSENTLVAKIMPANIIPRVWSLESSLKNISVKANIYYSRVSPLVKKNLVSAVKYAEPWLIPYLSKVENASFPSTNEEIEVIAQIFPQIRRFNVVMKTPNETLYMMDASIPKVWPFVFPVIPWTTSLRSVPILPEITMLPTAPKSFAAATYSICDVHPLSVTTFSNNTITLPEVTPECEIVVAQDCSPQRLYSVIATIVSGTGNRMTKILIPDYKIKFMYKIGSPDAELWINGVAHPMPTEEPLIMTRSVRGEMKAVLILSAHLSMGSRSFVLKAPEVGLEVKDNSMNALTVKLSPLLLSSVCGVCAHVPKRPVVNPWISRVGDAPNLFPVTSMREFVVRSEKCPANGLMQTGTGSISSCRTIERNAKVIRVHEGIPQTCFSVRMTATCPGFCSPVNNDMMSVGFHCMDTSDYNARLLAGQVIDSVPSGIANMMVNMHQRIMVPSNCAA